MSVEPFNKLVKLAARAFYDDITTKGENQPKNARSDNRGIAVVVLDALTRRQWVREEDLAKDLRLHSKQLRRTLRFFEEEKLITRDHRRETAKGAKIFTAAVAAAGDGHRYKEDDKIKMHTHSYCCLDYAQIHDVVRYRLHRMKKKLKDELEDKNTVQEYICPPCNRRYNALDALRLISMVDEYFHCENCNGELVAESDKLGVQGGGGGEGDDNARRRRREKLKDMLQNLEVQLKPLMEQLARVKELPVPEFGNLLAWEARAHLAARAAGDANGNDPSRSSQGLSGTPMPFLGDTKVEVAFSGADGNGEDVKSEAASTALKVLPPWMIKQGMNLTKEQCGEAKREANKDGASTSADNSDDKKLIVEDDEKKNLQDEYVKAYYAALLKKQQEVEEAAKQQEESSSIQMTSSTSPDRRVGEKSKRNDEDEGDDDVEWAESPVAGNPTETYRVDLNVEADATADDEEDDDIDWEEG